MTDEQYNKIKASVQKYLDKWLEPCGFTWWRITIEWVREYKDQESLSAAADTSVQWEYRQARVKFYMPMLEEMSEDRLEHLVVHELSHVLVASIHDFSDDNTRQMTEYATECVARALLYASSTVSRDTMDVQRDDSNPKAT